MAEVFGKNLLRRRENKTIPSIQLLSNRLVSSFVVLFANDVINVTYLQHIVINCAMWIHGHIYAYSSRWSTYWSTF